MLIKKREEVTKQGFCKILWRKLPPRWSLLLVLIQFQFQSHCHSRRRWRWGGGRLLSFSAFRMGANSRLGAYSNKYGNYIMFRALWHHLSSLSCQFSIFDDVGVDSPVKFMLKHDTKCWSLPFCTHFSLTIYKAEHPFVGWSQWCPS